MTEEKRVISEPFTRSKESELESRIKELEIELDHERSLFSGMSNKLVEISNIYGDVYTRLKEAEEVIKFYAESGHWGVGFPGVSISIDPCDHYDMFDRDYTSSFATRGGKRAREYFKKYGEEK